MFVALCFLILQFKMSLRQWGQIVKRGWQDSPETEKELGKEMVVTVV